MTTPNYFIADLPAEAPLTPQLIRDACETLKRNREQHLAARSTASLIRTLTSVAEDWLTPEFHLRRRALSEGPEATRFSKEILEAGLDAFFKRLTKEDFDRLIRQDLGHPQRLDALAASDLEEHGDRASLARGPELIAHVGGGVLPNPIFMSIVLGVLCRSAQFVKCASGAAFLPRLFAHSLYEADPKLGACLELAEWKGGATELESALFESADCVTATGSDETVSAISRALPPRARFLRYGHRVSFGYVAKESVSGIHFDRLVKGAAWDVAAWDQLGCLSPHVWYVEDGGKTSPETFADALARALQEWESLRPRGRTNAEEAGTIAYRRSFYQMRSAHGLGTRLWASPDSTAWTVVYEEDSRFQLSCLNRFIYVKPAADIQQVIESADAVRGRVSTVALAAPEDKARELANRLGAWGVSRVCRVGKMQDPPLAWRHDGRPSLGDLIAWTDWEL